VKQQGEVKLVADSLTHGKAAWGPEALTPLQSHHLVTGAHCVVSTNSQEILDAAQSFFREPADPQSPPTLSFRFWVGLAASTSRPWPQPFFRGLGHLAYAGFDSENSLILDLRRGSILGRFSPAMAADIDYWHRVIFPTLVGLASDALGVSVIHSACVERNGAGLLLAGESGAGKSTLSLAMAQCGFAFLSDDWTYLSHAGGQLRAWGLRTRLKLLPDAVRHFSQLRNLEPGMSLNGETAYEVDPEEVFGVRRSLRCEPRWLVFLERHDKSGHAFVRMPPEEAANRLGSAQGCIPRELSWLRKIQSATIRNLVEGECWLLRYGGNPGVIAEALERFCSVSRPVVRRRATAKNRTPFVRRGPDPTKRLTPTPYVADLTAAGFAIRLETNSPAILRRVGNAFTRSERPQPMQKGFVWRLILDEEAAVAPFVKRSSIVSAEGMRLVNMGQHSFIAMDVEGGCAVGFLGEEVLKDGQRFEKLVLGRLLLLTAEALTEDCENNSDNDVRSAGILPAVAGASRSRHRAGRMPTPQRAGRLRY
jgi:hypothetical protein